MRWLEVLIVGLGGVGRWTNQTTDGQPRHSNHPCPGRVVLPLSLERMMMLRLVQRERSADFSDLERLGCCGRVVGNLESEMLARMWEM